MFLRANLENSRALAVFCELLRKIVIFDKDAKNRPTIGDPGLTLVEAQSHFSLWAMAQSILVATNDVRERDPQIEQILLNPETIAVNQVSGFCVVNVFAL